MGGPDAGRALAAFSATARSPNLRRAQLSFGAAFAAEWALTVALGILAFRDGGATAVGVVAMARTLPAALLAPAAASFVDRRRRERVLLWVCLVRGAALALAALSVGQLGSPLGAYALAAVATLAHTLYRPAHSALLPSLCTTPEQLTSANVVRGMLDSTSALIGPLAAGLLVGPIGVSGVLGVTAGLALWSGWLIARVSYESPPRIESRDQAGSYVREALGGFAVMAGKRDVAMLSALFCLQTFTRGCFAVFAVVVAIELLDSGESGVGVLTAAFGAGAVAGSVAASLLISGRGFARWAGVSVALWGLPFALLAATSSELLALALLALVGVANAILDVSGFTLLQLLVPDEVMGRFFASFESLLTFTAALGSIVTPALIELFGVRGALVAVGLVGPCGTLAAWIALRRLDMRMAISARVVALLQRVAFLRPLPMATIAQLAVRARGETVSRGATVVVEGSECDDFFVIGRGQAEVFQGATLLRTLEAGDSFGEIAALGRGVRTSSVRAQTDMRLLRISGDHLVRAVTRYAPSRSAADAVVQERLARSAGMRV
jgi:MFS family permease